LLQIKPSKIPAIGWMLLVTVLLCIPGKEFPSATWLSKIWIDKWIHIGLFLVMVVLWCWSISGKSQESLKVLFGRIALLSILYGVVMEMIQGFFIPYRSFEILDIATDGIGSLSGLVFATRWYIKK
jgi:VanZ family protein